MKHTLLYIATAAALTTACKQDTEQQARLMLGEARVELAAKHYDAARNTIKDMRKQYPRAICMRREALLLLDSIEYMAAQDSLTNAATDTDAQEYIQRAQFYYKKLVHDAQALEK